MPIPSDYPGMTADQLDGYIADFLTAIYGEEVRDKFARIAYLIGHQIPAEAEEVVDNAKESATAASLAAEEASDHAAAAKKSEVAAQQYMTTASEHVVKAGEYRTEAADSAAESQTNADQAYNWNQNCLTLYHQTQNLTNQVESYVEQILGVGYHVKIITESEYENLDTGFDPNTLYIVLESTYNPLDSLVSYYPLTSDLADYLNNAKVGQAVGCLGFGNWDSSGSSFYIKRSDPVPLPTKHENYISLPNNLLEGIDFSNGATFVIRCKPDKAVSAGNGDWTRIFNFYKHASSAPNDGEGEVYLTQGLIGTWYYNAQSVQYLDASVAGTLAANQWHTVALVIEPIKPDNTHVKVSVFVDYRTIGSTQGVFTGTDWLNKVDQNWIGASRFDDDDFTGMVKDFRVYNKALSDSELTNVMDSNFKWRLRWNGGQDESFSDLDKKIQDILDGTTPLPYLPTSGGAMAGDVDMDGNAITGLPDPAADTDAIPKSWADERYALAFASPRYGVRFSGSGNSGSTVTRLYDAVGLTAAVGTDTATAVNDFDGIAPWSTRRRCCGYWDDAGQFVINAYEGEPGYTTDGSNGEVWVESSLWYYQHTVSEDGVEEIIISTYQYPGFSPAPIFLSQGGQAQPYLKAYTAAYPMATVDGKPTSRSGVFPGSYSLNAAMTEARTAGENYCTTTAGEWYSDWLLMVVEFATRNLQAIMVGATQLPWATTHTALVAETGANRIIISASNASGYVVGQTIGIGTTQGGNQVCSNRRITSIETVEGGTAINFDGDPVDIAVGNMVYSLAWITGTCDGVQSSSGSYTSNTSGKYNCIYRGKEKPYGDCFEWCCDVLFQRHGAGTAEDPYTYTTHYLPDPTKYSGGAITEDYVQLGYGIPVQDGYSTALGLDERFPWVRIPSAIGGSTSTYYSDYYQYPRYAVTAGRLGGSWSSWGGAGPACWHCYSAPSGSGVDYRARLSFHRT